METASFDVFDTLLTRVWAEPQDLFIRLGHDLQVLGITTLAPGDFAAERCAAEKRARKQDRSHEVTLDPIYRELGQRLGWTEDQTALAQAAEIDLEAQSIRPVPFMLREVSRARERGSRIVFLSDMYLPSAVIRTWLERAGFFAPGDAVFVSGEMGGGKGTGALFEIARARTGARFRNWTHTGDNRFSDFECPRRLGIDTRLCLAAELTPREQRLRGTHQFAPSWQSRLAGSARQARLSMPDHLSETHRTLWETGTAVAGPLFWAFTDWCLRDAERRGLDDLYFLARGGQIFLRIAKAIQSVRPGKVRCHYLHTSRLTFAGIADIHDPSRLRQLANAPVAFHSVRQACANLGLEASETLVPPRFPRDQWDRNLSPSERSLLADWLLAPEQHPLIEAAIMERKMRARAYLQQQGLGANSRTGVVDTGWMGTIQRSMEILLGSDSTPVPLTGYYLGLSPRLEFDCRGERLAYTNRFCRLPLRRETTHLIMLELMARADHGPLLSFELDASGTAVPRLANIDAASREDVDVFQSSILRFVQAQIEPVIDLEAPPAESLAWVVIRAYRSLVGNPTRAEAKCLGRIPHADQMLEQRHTGLCPEMSLRQILAAMADFHQRPPGWWLQGQAVFGHTVPILAYLGLKRLKWALKTILLGEQD